MDVWWFPTISYIKIWFIIHSQPVINGWLQGVPGLLVFVTTTWLHDLIWPAWTIVPRWLIWFSQIVISYSMVVEMVPVKGGIGGIVHPPIGRKNTTYIPLIYCLLGGYMLPTTFYGNQKQPLTYCHPCGVWNNTIWERLKMQRLQDMEHPKLIKIVFLAANTGHTVLT